MPIPGKLLLAPAAVAVTLWTAPGQALHASDADLLPPRLPKEQRDNLLRFLQEQAKPERFIPPDAKVIDSQPTESELKITGTPEKPIKQYTVQITSHRPVPGQEEVKRVDVVYYRPHPEKGKPGVTVKHTVDLTTGKQVGATEVLYKSHTPISREELAEAVALAKEKSTAVQALYKDRDEKKVQWEYLQLLISRKHEQQEPGDRAVRLVFKVVGDDPAPAPVAVIVNLTKGVVAKDER